jgi:hypothetical protein
MFLPLELSGDVLSKYLYWEMRLYGGNYWGLPCAALLLPPLLNQVNHNALRYLIVFHLLKSLMLHVQAPTTTRRPATRHFQPNFITKIKKLLQSLSLSLLTNVQPDDGFSWNLILHHTTDDSACWLASSAIVNTNITTALKYTVSTVLMPLNVRHWYFSVKETPQNIKFSLQRDRSVECKVTTWRLPYM